MPRATVWFLAEDIQLCNRLSAHVEPFRNAVNALCCTYSHMTCVEYLLSKSSYARISIIFAKKTKGCTIFTVHWVTGVVIHV